MNNHSLADRIMGFIGRHEFSVALFVMAMPLWVGLATGNFGASDLGARLAASPLAIAMP